MRAPLYAVLALAVAVPAFADEPPRVSAEEIFSSRTTASGQPIVLPRKDAEVVVYEYEIPPGVQLPVHRHPWPRYAYVLSGRLRVETPDGARYDYGPGDFVVEVLDSWHFGRTLGKEPVRLLVIDQVKAGESNTELKQD